MLIVRTMQAITKIATAIVIDLFLLPEMLFKIDLRT